MFLLVVDILICSEQPQFRSDCDITWVKLEYLAAFYKPKAYDQDSLDGLRNSLDGLIAKIRRATSLLSVILIFQNSHGLTANHISDRTVLLSQFTTVLWTYLMTITLFRL